MASLRTQVKAAMTELFTGRPVTTIEMIEFDTALTIVVDRFGVSKDYVRESLRG